MRFSLFVIVLAAAPAFAGPAAKPAAPAAPAKAAAPEWSLDTAHSRIGFSVRHLAVSNVHGDFKDFAVVSIKADADGKLETVEATAQAKSVNTGNEKRDEHLRGDDFFNAEKFPVLKFKAKSIQWTGDKFTAEVDLTIRDKTKTVKFEGEKSGVSHVNFGKGPQTQVGYTATGKVNRKEFGLGWTKVIEAVPVVGDEVKIEIEIELSRQGA